MLFRKKKKEQLESLIASFMPEPVVSISKMANAELVEDVLIEFVFLVVEESELFRFKAFCSHAIEIAASHQALIIANAGGLIQLAVGPRLDSVDCKAVREKLTSDLALSLGGAVRIVHGRARSRVGTVGTAARKNWGYFPIAILSILQALCVSVPGIPVDLGDL